LLQLAGVEWPEDPPRSLEALARRLVTAAKTLRELERALYAPGNAAWQGHELWKLFRNGMPAEQTDSIPDAPGLAPLYPEWDRRRGHSR